MTRTNLGPLTNSVVETSNNTTPKKDSVTLVRERTIPTERPQHVGDVSANVCGQSIALSAQRIPTAELSIF
jgi:hypothetical protein